MSVLEIILIVVGGLFALSVIGVIGWAVLIVKLAKPILDKFPRDE